MSRAGDALRWAARLRPPRARVPDQDAPGGTTVFDSAPAAQSTVDTGPDGTTRPAAAAGDPAPTTASAQAAAETAPGALPAGMIGPVQPVVPAAEVPRQVRWPGPAWAFRMAVAATLGAFGTYVLLRAVLDVGSVLVLILVALVIALGLDPIVSVLVRRGLRRSWAVALVTLGFLVVLAGFFAAIVPPIATEGQQLVANMPTYLRQLQDHSSTLGRINDRYHVLSQVQRYVTSGGTTLLSGLVGVGAAIFGAVASALTVLVLTVYFLANVPGIKRLVLLTTPASHRIRTRAFLEEAFSRVGGYVLGNVLTSVIAGLGTLAFLEVVRVPYPLALSLFVAVLDLVPVVGSTIAGAAVSLVALSVSVPTAIATLVFYVVYRLAEDYLLVPRVMRHAVNVPPVVTIVALLIGGALLGVIGALLAIPAAAVIELVLSEYVWPRLQRA
jgi:predicted PurR-regulated permease PerM